MRGGAVEFRVPKQQKENQGEYSQEAKDLAYKFAKGLMQEAKGFIKAIVLFGSAARKKSETGDIDVLVVVDDVDIQVTEALTQGYRVIVKKLVQDISTKLHVTTIRYTTFWEYARAGDPVGVNILRDGVALIDTGFFTPLQRLLYTGRIRPSTESIWTYYGRAPVTLQNAKGHLLQGAVDLYWAVIDASHAALMKLGEVPPSPEHVPDLLQEKLVKAGLLPKKYAGICREFYRLSRSILHKERTKVTGKEFDQYVKLAEDYIAVMRKFVEKQ